MQNKTSVGISFNKELLIKIDKARGDISRSRYVLKFLEKSLSSKKSSVKENKDDLLDVGLSPPRSSKSRRTQEVR